MAIIKISSPLSTSPSVFAEPVLNQLLALAIDCNHGNRIGNGYVKKGSLWNIGGVMFIADADTAIAGSKNQGLSTCALAIRFSVSGSTATATYINDLTGVAWNGEYQGYYDSSGNMYYYKCQKLTLPICGVSTGVFLNQSPYFQEIKSASYPGVAELYKTNIEKTGSYMFGLQFYGGINIYINESLAYNKGSVSQATVVEIPLFLEEGDLVSVKSTGAGRASVWGLANDTFGSVPFYY